MAPIVGQPSPLFRPFSFFFLQRAVRTLLGRQQEVGQGLIAQGRVSKKNDQQRNADAEDVEGQSYPLPAGLAGIVKNRLGHENCCVSILS